MAPANGNTEQITTNISIESWPKVKAGKQTLEVKWGMMSRFILSNWGVQLEEALEVARTARAATPEVRGEDGNVITPAVPAFVDPRYTARMMELFAACVGHNYAQLGQDPPNAGYWASIIEEDQWQACLDAIFVAMGKANAAKQKPQAPLTKQAEAQPAQDQTTQIQ